MAGLCTGSGLGVGADGKPMVEGPNILAWPNQGMCPIEANNGLKVDPITNFLWVPPTSVVMQNSIDGANRAFVPGDATSFVLDTIEASITVPRCAGHAAVIGWVAAGYCAMRSATGNFWTIERNIGIFVDGAPGGYTGNQIVFAHENNATGVTTHGGGLDNEMSNVTLLPGQVFKMVATYTFNPLGFSASVANGVDWRPPRMRLALWSYGG